MFFGKKKNPHETGCFVCHIVVSVLLFLASVAAFVEAIVSHYAVIDGLGEASVIFGSNAGSLSLIAFGVTVTLWMKSLKACMMGCEACGPVGKK